MQNILIVEDNAFLRKLCAKHLARNGREIRMASDGGDAMKEIEKQQPDLLLLDLLLPHVDGFTVLDFIRDKGYAFPVIILSNIEWKFDSKGSQLIGATHYFIKSDIDIPDLVKKIEECLAAKTPASA